MYLEILKNKHANLSYTDTKNQPSQVCEKKNGNSETC